MNAAILTEPGKPLQIAQIPIPEPGLGDVLIKIVTCGVCHTDVHVRDGELSSTLSPLIPGHEGAGEVVKVGEGVKNLKVGDRVGVSWLHDACGSCEHCLEGWDSICLKQRQTGFTANGCFAEYIVAPAAYVARIPDNLSFEMASPILCAGVTTYKGLKETQVRPGQWVAVVGSSGGLGHVAMQYARYMGMKVLAIDFGKDRIEYSLSHGAHIGVDAKEPNLIERVKEVTNGGPHGVLMLAPSTKAYEQAVQYLRPRGVLSGIALPPGSFSVNILDWALSRKTLRGSIVGSRLDMQEALSIAADGGVKCDVQEKKLEEVNSVLDDLKGGKIKGRVVLRMSQL